VTEYERNTVDASNVVARFAHRRRVAYSARLALQLVGTGPMLDYGCGTGSLVEFVNQARPQLAVGYEPFMATNRPGVYRDFGEIAARAPYSLITLCEVVEHLDDRELDELSERAERVLRQDGKMLISVPIEIGPALLAKEFNRAFLKGKASEYALGEFLRAAVAGIPGRRTGDIKGSHKGFDFRRAMAGLRQRGWHVGIVSYGPLPLPTWYGNSQAYMIARRPAADLR
jgi:hypothetical protein